MKQISNQKILSEFLGTFLLVLTIVGSGIMGENLSDNLALTLLGNSCHQKMGLTAYIVL